MMLSFSITRKNTESQKKLFNEVTRSLERRWVEIKGKSSEKKQIFLPELDLIMDC